MWRRYREVLSMLHGHYPRASVGNHYHLFSTCGGAVVSYAVTDKSLQRPSSNSHPSVTRHCPRYGDIRSSNSLFNFLLISSHAFSTRHYNRPRVPMMKDLNSVEEVIVTAYEYLDDMSRRDISAVWARIALLMTKRQPEVRGKSLNNFEIGKVSFEDLEYMLYTIFDNTTDGIEECSMRELSETTLGMAKIVQILRQQGKRREEEDNCRLIMRRLIMINKDKKPNRDLFKFLANVSMIRLDQFDARHISNLAYAYALIGYVPEFDDGRDLFDHIAMKAVEVTKEAKPQEISNMVWAYATVDKQHDLLFEKMGDEIVASKNLKEFRPQALSNTVWAYATAGINHPRLFEKVASHIVQSNCLDQFKPQELSNTVWACATASINHPKLFEALANHIVESDCLHRFNPQALANTVWAYATTGINHPRLFETVANHIVETSSLDRFIPQALANTVWSYATVGINHPRLFEKVASHIVGTDLLDRFDPQAFSNTVWAYATTGINHPRLFEKVGNHIVESDHLDRFKPQVLANTVWAYATAQASHPKLFQKVAKAAIRRKEKYISQNVANLLWAYATMGITDKQLFSSFVSTAAKSFDSSSNQDVANIAWAYAVANVDAPTLFNDVFIKTCVKKKDGFEAEALFQLYQWHLWQTKEKSNAGLPQDLRDRSYKAFVSEDPTISKFQEDVVSQLKSIGLNPKEEVLMGSGYRIDALVEVNGKTIGVEVDGPYHFIGKSRSPLGSTILKRRQVPAIDGIEFVSVPYWDWNKLGKSQTKKHEYLRKLLGLVEDIAVGTQ